MNITNVYNELVRSIVENQHENGSWGDEQDSFNIFVTSMVLRFLSSHLNNNHRIKAAEYVIRKQFDNGSWNNDTFDTCNAIIALNKNEQENKNTIINRAIEFLKLQVSSNWKSELQNRWFGPSDIIATLQVNDMFQFLSDEDVMQCNSLINKFLVDNTKFVNYAGLLKDRLEPFDETISIEHTSNVILYRISKNENIEKKFLTNMIEWFMCSQNLSGSWGGEKGFFTSFCIKTFIHINNLIEDDNLKTRVLISTKRGIEYILQNSVKVEHINTKIINCIFLNTLMFYENTFEIIEGLNNGKLELN